MRRTLVLVADSARARLFTTSAPKGPLDEFEDLVHPEARGHPHDFTRDRPGHAFDRVGAGRHNMGDVETPREHEAAEFAREIAERLDAGRHAGEFEQLVLVAPPDFLGTLRKALTPQTEKLVGHAIGKNLAQYKPNEIRARLPAFL